MKQAETASWEFELFINDQTRRSIFAEENLRAFCERHLKGRSHIRIIDLAKHPELAAENRICVCPTLIIRRPLPERTLVGDLSNTGKVLQFLELPLPTIA